MNTMPSSFNNPKATQLDALLQQLDMEGETSSPDQLEPEEAAGLSEIPEEEAAGPEEEADLENTGDLNALTARGRASFSPPEVQLLMRRATKRGQAATGKAVARTATKRPQVHIAPTTPKLPPNLTHPQQGLKDLVDRWSQKNHPYTVRQEGHYYFVAEVAFTVEGDPKTQAWARLKAGTDIHFFDKTVGDETSFLGNKGKVNLRQTNYQRPSKDTYNDQDFLIKTINMREAGLRIAYPAAAIASVKHLAPISQALSGGSWVWDDSKKLIPGDIFHDFSAENLLYRALRGSAVLFFRWDRLRTGGNGVVRNVLIDNVEAIPDVRERKLSRTSGGSDSLTVPDGYVFSDNPEKSEDGAFSAIMSIEDEIVFPISCVDIGNGSPELPSQIGLYVQLSLNGISFERVKARR